MTRKPQLGLLGAALVAVAVPVAVATGQGATQPGEDLCADRHPCTILNGYAAGGSSEELSTAPEALATDGRPASECSEAVAAYQSVGLDPAAVIGPCPPASSLPSVDDAAAINENHRMALQALESGE